MTAPVIHTPHLTLRPHVPADFGPYSDFLGSSRAQFMGGPIGLEAAWTWFTSDIAQWALYGFGALAITNRITGAFRGQVSIHCPPRWPEPELSWFVVEGAEGEGIAHEAARWMIAHATADLGLDTLVSYVNPSNTRAIALAERLGATRDDGADQPYEGDLVYRYGLGDWA